MQIFYTCSMDYHDSIVWECKSLVIIRADESPEAHFTTMDELTLIPARITNHLTSQVWGEITYPFPKFDGATVEVWELISDFI